MQTATTTPTAEAERALGAARSATLPVAVSADSLATWFREVFGAAADWEDVALVLRVEDQAWSHDLLRRGEVLAVVTSDPEPVQGCRAEALGALRYHAAASPEFAARWRKGRCMDWAAMPLVVLPGRDRVDVRLHWQRWHLESDLLDRLTDDVRRAARVLRCPPLVRK